MLRVGAPSRALKISFAGARNLPAGLGVVWNSRRKVQQPTPVQAMLMRRLVACVVAASAARRTQTTANEGHVCRVCKKSLPSRSQLFKHLRLEHPKDHINYTCSACDAWPVRGTCFTCSDSRVLCKECFESRRGEPEFASACFLPQDTPEHMKGLESKPPAKPACPPAGPALQVPDTRFPRSLLDAFNQRALEEEPSFRIPSEVLSRTVPWEDLDFAWRNGLLCGVPIGLKSTFAPEDEERWLELAREDRQRDVALSPRRPAMTPQLLVALLRYNTCKKEFSCKDLRAYAKSVWDMRDSVEEWQVLAEGTPGVCTEPRSRYSRSSETREHLSSLVKLSEDRRSRSSCLDAEETAFGFFQKVDQQQFDSLRSLAESLYYYQGGVPADQCYALVAMACRSGSVVNVEGSRGQLRVRLKGDHLVRFVHRGACQTLRADEATRLTPEALR